MAPPPAAALSAPSSLPTARLAAAFVLGAAVALFLSAAAAPASGSAAPLLRETSGAALLAQLAAAQADIATLQAAAQLALAKEAAAEAAAAAAVVVVAGASAASAASAAASAAKEPPPVVAAPQGSSAAADGCYHVYVDVGSNVAVQYHKLWDPALLLASGPDIWGDSDMRVMPHFERYFGPAPRADVCAFGFEPNPNHSALLRRTVAHYAAADLRMTIFEAGAGTFDGLGVVKSDGDAINNEWATSITPLAAGEVPPASAIVIPIKNIVSWILPNVINRRLPPAAGAGARPPAIVMKLDAEGSEQHILTALLEAGALCHITFVYCDTLPDDFSAGLAAALAERKCDTVVVRVGVAAALCKLPPRSVGASPHFVSSLPRHAGGRRILP